MRGYVAFESVNAHAAGHFVEETVRAARIGVQRRVQDGQRRSPAVRGVK